MGAIKRIRAAPQFPVSKPGTWRKGPKRKAEWEAALNKGSPGKAMFDPHLKEKSYLEKVRSKRGRLRTESRLPLQTKRSINKNQKVGRATMVEEEESLTSSYGLRRGPGDVSEEAVNESSWKSYLHFELLAIWKANRDQQLKAIIQMQKRLSQLRLELELRNGSGGAREEGISNSQSGSRRKEHVTCFHCQRQGHYADKCSERKRERAKAKAFRSLDRSDNHNEANGDQSGFEPN